MPPWKYDPGPSSTRPSVSKLTMRGGPSACLWVDVKPRKSSEPVRDQIGPRHAGGGGQLLRQARAAVEAAACEPLADARHLEHAVHRVEDRRRALLNVIEVVAPQQEGDVVLLEHDIVGIAREANRVQQCTAGTAGGGGATIDRQVALCGARDVLTEVRKPPGHGDRQPVGCPGMLVFEVPEDALECGLLLQPRLRADRRRHDLVVQRRHDDLDPVVVDDPQAVEQVLLRGTTLAEMAGRRCGQLID